MKLVFSTTGRSFTPGNSRTPDEDCFEALAVRHARRVAERGADTHQVEVDLNTAQAQALIDQLLRDYPYLNH